MFSEHNSSPKQVNGAEVSLSLAFLLKEVFLPLFSPDILERLEREGHIPACTPFPSERLSDVGRVCDLSKEEPATY